MSNPDLTRRGALAGALGAGAVAIAAGPARAHRGPVDAIVVNGAVLTMGRRARPAQALAVRGGRVVAVGSTREIGRMAGRRTQVVDAAGGTVLPGINDSHLHLSAFALTLPPLSYNVDAPTIEALVEVVRGAVAASTVPGEWIRGQGWNDNRLPRAPQRADLDAVSGDHPVILTDFSFHAIAVNTVALRLAGVTRDTVPPPGGVIEKDADGEPTGVLRETAQGLVAGIVPARTRAEIETGLRSSIGLMHSIGITSVTDPGIDATTLQMYADFAGRGELGVRVNAMLAGGTSLSRLTEVLEAHEPLRGVDPTLLRAGQVKLFADGIPTAAQTAWLHEPYLDGTNGSLVTEGTTIEEQVQTLHAMIALAGSRGFQVGTHATGDATIDAVVAGYLRAARRDRRCRDRRNYVIHGDLAPLETLRTMARHDIGVNMNGTIKYLLGRTLDPVLGPERTDYQWPYRSALDAGVRVSSSSDAPVTFPSWLQGVMAMRLREGMFGGVAGEAQRISVAEALATYTRTPAHQDHASHWKGTLEPGRVADVCIVDGDVLGADPHALVEMQVSATMVGGEVVFDGASASGRRTAASGAASAGSAAWSHQRSADCLAEGLCCCTLSEKVSA